MDNTIAAISTALNEGGIGIIRISGDNSISVANRIFKNKRGENTLSSFKSHTIHYGFIYDGDVLLDEVMVSVMKAPNTFTKEDVVEINCHGGVLVCKKILDLCLKNGADLAEPGEFTKRAFLNGRIDLSKAEAVMDVISSSNTLSLNNSLKILEGKLYSLIKSLRERVLYEIAFIESALDDPEHISLVGYPEELENKVNNFIVDIDKLIKSSNTGRLLKEGINTVILGKPNVGKSSLLNSLIGFEKAIVTDIAGTTRDAIEEHISLNNVSLNIFDTAGIRNTDDVVENIGVNRAKKYADDADLILFVIDSSSSLSSEDREIIELIKNKNVIVLLNKSDLSNMVSKEEVLSLFDRDCDILEISAKEDIGIDELERKIENMFLSGSVSSNSDFYITNLRHVAALNDCKNSFELVLSSINDGMPEDFFSIDLMNAYSSLGKIIGEDVDDDLVNEIFTKFCMGK